MIITVINVGQPQQVPGKKYSTLEINYKDEQGRVQGRKLMSFSNPTVFNTAKTLQQGDQADVTLTKEGEYWNWTGLKKLEGGAQATAASTTQAFSGAASNRYETAEERAQRQVLIVRQSSLSSAVAALTAGAKAPPKVDEILALAVQFEAYVFDKQYDDGSIETLESDIPS